MGLFTTGAPEFPGTHISLTGTLAKNEGDTLTAVWTQVGNSGSFDTLARLRITIGTQVMNSPSPTVIPARAGMGELVGDPDVVTLTVVGALVLPGAVAEYTAIVEVIDADSDVRAGPLLELPLPPSPEPSRIKELTEIPRADWTNDQMRELIELLSLEIAK